MELTNQLNSRSFKNTTGRLTGKRAIREYATTYDISYEDRIDLRGAWTFARALGTPFNTLLTVKYPSTGLSSDIELPRYVVHKIRVFLRMIGVPSHILWSRHIQVGSGIEECMILIHLPDEAIKHFVSVAQRWHPSIDLTLVDYGANLEYKGQPATVFDLMFRAVDKKTLHKDPTVICEASDPIYGPRFFNSFKLSKKRRIEHRRENQKSDN
ncbi:MAG: hypothetical protein ACRYGP_22180 [Janthinobacterium lividum]